MFTGTNFCDGFFKTSSSFSEKDSELMSEISTSYIQHFITYLLKKTAVLRKCRSKSFSCIAYLSWLIVPILFSQSLFHNKVIAKI